MLARILRRCLQLLTRIIYRISVVGSDNVPATGPVLVVSNHISYADPVLISITMPRPVRFLMWRPIYHWRPLAWFFRLMRAIPIAQQDGPRQMVKSLMEARQALEAGECVGLFAEGEISRSGELQEFRKGLEFITRDIPVQIVPVNIHGMWGSIFSYEGGKFFWKWPRHIPYPVQILFGPPLPGDTPSEAVRQAILKLVPRPY